MWKCRWLPGWLGLVDEFLPFVVPFRRLSEHRLDL
jgi:hypothetical protein